MITEIQLIHVKTYITNDHIKLSETEYVIERVRAIFNSDEEK